MTKPFLEVFQTLKLDPHTKEELTDVQVEKISTTEKRDLVRIYLSSNRLIEKSDVVKAEKEIKKQLFKETNLTVKIYERFFLSAQYTPQNLLEMYKDSIMLEFKNYDPIEYTVLKSADFEFPEKDRVTLVL